MRVHCLIPVHNRLDQTRQVLDCLASQDFPKLSIVVVDDGSTDGTSEWIMREHPGVDLLRGDGSLWWGGAVASGLALCLPRSSAGDFVLLQNNDTRFASDYISTLVCESQNQGRAVIGSMIMDMDRPETVLSIAPRVNYWKTRITDLLQEYETRGHGSGKRLHLPDLLEVDALCGRGTLYPIEVFHRIGGVRHRMLPHYLADYELSVRAKQAGFRTLVSTRAVVWTEAKVSGVHGREVSAKDRLFDRRSRTNIFDSMAFFTFCGPWYLRLTGAPRVALFRIWGAIRNSLFPSR